MPVDDEVKEYYEAIVPSHCKVSDEVREAMEYAIQFTLKRHRDILSIDACERERVLTKG
jgi:fibrillarin-like rRNA methylase